jgi:hypothetical protein
MEWPVQVDCQIAVPFIVGHRLGMAHGARACDIHQYVELTEFGDALCDSLPARLRSSDINRCVTTAGHRSEHLCQPTDVPRYPEHRGTAPGEDLCHRRAQPRRRTRDQSNFSR